MRPRRDFSNIKPGWHVIGCRRIYFRSKLEYQYALKLQRYEDEGFILDWEFEPKVFYFEGIRRGVTNYTPDFQVFNNDGSHHWVETKGYMDAKSKTKIKRFAKYFPNEKLYVVRKV